MRLFIAFELPEHISQELRKIQEHIKQPGIKLVKEFHLTFRFIGEVEDDKVGQIKSELENIEFEPFEASLNGIGVFPNINRINAIWVGIEPEDKMNKLANIIDPEETRFKAHVTLGRVKFLKSKQDKEKLIENINKVQVPKLTFNLDKIKLIKSTLTKEGPIYETIFEKPL